MARFLLAWELGGGLGHASTLATIAQALLERGHEVDLVWRDVDLGASLLGAAFNHPRLRFFAAPAWAKAKGRPTPIGPTDVRTYADLLCLNGFHDTPRLTGQLKAWLSLLRTCQPDVLVVDHAPVALLAARHQTGLRTAQVGSGFFQPPTSTPFPSYRFWEAQPPARHFEHIALQSCRTAQGACGVPQAEQLRDLGELLHTDLDLLLTWPELHHYGPEPGPRQQFVGPLPSQDAKAPPQWPAHTEQRERCLAYLHANDAALDETIEVLIQAKVPTLLATRYLPEAQRAKLAGHAHIQHCDDLVNMADAISQSTFVLSHGGTGLIMAALSRGKPLLLLPKHSEQWINAYRVCTLNAGISLQTPELVERGVDAMHALASQPHFQTHAQALARQHPPEAVHQHLAEVCDLLTQAADASG